MTGAVSVEREGLWPRGEVAAPVGLVETGGVGVDLLGPTAWPRKTVRRDREADRPPPPSFGELRGRYETDGSFWMDGTVFNVIRDRVEAIGDK